MALSERKAGIALVLAGLGATVGLRDNWDSVMNPDKEVRVWETRVQQLKNDPDTRRAAQQQAFNTCVRGFTRWFHGTDSNDKLSEVTKQITRPGPNAIAKMAKLSDANRPAGINDEIKLVRYDFDDCAAKGVERHEQELERQLQFARESKTSGAAATIAMGAGLPLVLIGGGFWLAWPRRRNDRGGLPMGHDLG